MMDAALSNTLSPSSSGRHIAVTESAGLDDPLLVRY